MILSGIRAEDDRVCAEVKWEDSNRAPQTIFVAGHDLRADPNGFLVLSFLPAWKSRERRVLIEGDTICPVLQANLSAASQTLSRWRRFDCDPPLIEGTAGIRPPGDRVGLFFSGGVDSLASLRTNLDRIQHPHPERISAAILVQGDMADSKFKRLREVQEIIANETGVQPISLKTNVHCLHNHDMSFYINTYHGSFLAGLAHFLDQFRKLKISATFDAANLEPWGSHPLLDPFYSSAHLTIEHNGLEMSRFAKAAVVAEWPTALNHVNVCSSLDLGENCGRCEKCLRTMLALIALGKLNAAAAFPERDLRAEDLANLKIRNPYQASCYRDLVLPLREQGRADLAAVLERKLTPSPSVHPFRRKARAALRAAVKILTTANNRQEGPGMPS